VTDDQEVSEIIDPPTERSRAVSLKIVLVLVVVALFAGVVTAKVLASRSSRVADGRGGIGPALTSTHNDAVADYEAATKTGKPVYVLFHSLS
jgi:hypothetical protein